MIMALCPYGPHLSICLFYLIIIIGHAGRGRRVFFSCLVPQGVSQRYPHSG